MARRLLLLLGIALLAATGGPGSAEAATRLRATVGPGLAISLRTGAGQRVTKLKAGTYMIVVVDRSKIDNFHLRGSGINTIDKRMRAAFVGTATWRVSLSPGKYSYRSDAHASSMKGTFEVV